LGETVTQTAESEGDLLDLIYAAAVDPSLWGQVMERTADSVGGQGAAILVLAHDVAQTLEALADAVFILGHGGRIRHLNRAAERLLSQADVLTSHGGRLTARHSEASGELQRLVVLATRPMGLRCGGSMSLGSIGSRFPLAVRVAPISARLLPIFDPPPSALVTVTDLEAWLQTPEEDLRRLFGLTLAESRTAAAVFDGLSLPQAAERFGVSANTVRTQLKLVFNKTGVTRQADLVKLMMRLSGGRS
jgi:DNA-binding CsgD family transcriptional regulator